ncbi:hypothetical protein EGM51_00180 [Verrucomicrobia bacterium S94]|nr:hypothetical protein EGM51_00180 [Verrucomicrobia bacterium S94]
MVYPEDIKFRFWGFGDDALAVRVDGELVLLSCFPQWVTDFKEHTEHLWQSSSADSEKYPMANHHSVVGDWIELKANEPKEIEILLGESHGGIFAAMLCVQVEGVEYDRNPHRNGPTLPFFKTEEFTKDMVEVIYNQLHPGEATCEMGPVFNDFSHVSPTSRYPLVYDDPVEPAPPLTAEDHGPEMRTWTTVDNKQFEAIYKTRLGSTIVLENSRRKQKQVPVSLLSPEDREYVNLLNPPQFKIDLSKSSNQRTLPETTPWLETNRRLQIVDYQFGVRLKPATADLDYNYPLEVEYFVFGEEATGDNYVLLDRKSDIFTPSPENKGEFVMMGDQEVEMKLQAVNDEGSMRGVRYGGYLVTITDKDGYIVQYKATHEFLFKNLNNLRNVPVGKHFNENCNRVMPDRPKDVDRFTITL